VGDRPRLDRPIDETPSPGVSVREVASLIGDADVPVDAFDGVGATALREALHLPALHLYSTVGSALDVAHRLAAEGATHGTLVLADTQTRGRGRGGKRWASPPGTGLWMTLIARPASADSIRVLTVRLGLAAAVALDAFAVLPVQLKWPNDLYVGAGKLAGVLVEARWRGATPEWLAIGIGVNVVAPASTGAAAGLRPGTRRVAVLEALVPAIGMALARVDRVLGEDELRAYARRDIAAGRQATAPARGTILGINPAAELLIATGSGDVALGSGSLVLSEDL
jgi:BirA family biotin operon repressor/biotin-[acetyl-CoA-carboxylase] ligase